ncbi:unnamed protein product [Orchesella dallaii]|uniref:Peptidase S8/S53 domain-containing protein n=1 Tax=Orchesella dallaii TaxID=48710 RepID=A0ABP1R594_9HEXA
MGAISCETYHGETEEALTRDITTPQTADDDYQKKESEIVQPFIYLKNRAPTEKYMDLQTDTTEEIIDFAELEEYEKVIVPGILRKESEENTEEHKDKNEDVTTRATSSTRRPIKNMGKKSIFDFCYDLDGVEWYQPDKLMWWGELKHSKIQAHLFQNGIETRPVIVSFGSTHKIKTICDKVGNEYAYYPKAQRAYALYHALYNYSKECQTPAQTYLDSNSYSYSCMMPSNTMIVHKADHQCVHKLAALEDVNAITEDTESPLEPIEIEGGNNNSFSDLKIGMSWGLSKIYAKEAWKFGAYYGYTTGGLRRGQGVTVGHIDSGYNQSNSHPEDLNGHGTHTMGTIVGSYKIGVAPDAEWISCRGCLQSSCHHSALLFCCGWILCPYNTTTKSKADHYSDCYSTPDLVSNSWGSVPGNDLFDRCIYAWQAAKIIPVFSIGNSGPNCNTTGSPGNNEYAIGIGACTENDELAVFSSRGPTDDGRMKPDFCCPGTNIVSSWMTNDTAYISLKGTSMACPHAAGIIALMLSWCKLPYQIVYNILQSTAETEYLGVTDQVCGNTTSDVFPNNFFGHGRLNSLKAVIKTIQVCSKSKYVNPSTTHPYSTQVVPYSPGYVYGQTQVKTQHENIHY